MKTERSNGALVGGTLLVGFGLLALASQLLRNTLNWSYLWPFAIIVAGLLFFAGMFALGRQASGLAIPGAIVTGIGLILFYQSLASHWESWAYAWALIVFFVGVGIYIAGVYGTDNGQKRAGKKLMQLGFTMFVIFGAFFELIFSSGRILGYRGVLFPILLILLGGYLILRRLGIPGFRAGADSPISAEKPSDTP